MQLYAILIQQKSHYVFPAQNKTKHCPGENSLSSGIIEFPFIYPQILPQNGTGSTHGNGGSCGQLPLAPPGAVIINGHAPPHSPLGHEPPSETHCAVCLKWTPNRLMNGGTVEDKSASWQHAVAVDMKDIIFMHCHQVPYYVHRDPALQGDQAGPLPGLS